MILELKALIDAYLDRTNWTLHTIANRAGVGYSTLRRIYNDSGNSKPRFATIRAILNVVATQNIKSRFINDHFPDETIGYVPYDFEDSVETAHIDEDKRAFLRRYPHKILIPIAFTTAGLTRSTAKKVCGELGERAFEDLIANGFIEKSGPTYRCPSLLFSLDETIDMIASHCSYFNDATLGTLSRAMMLSASFDKEGLKKFAACKARFIKEIVELTKDRSIEGDVPVYVGLISSPYITPEEE